MAAVCRHFQYYLFVFLMRTSYSALISTNAFAWSPFPPPLDITVVAHTNGSNRIQSYLEREFDKRINLVVRDEYQGTIEDLRSTRHLIHNDFIVVGCDLITNASLTKYLQRWRLGDARVLCLLTTPVPLNFGQQPKESSEPKHRYSDGLTNNSGFK
jgi:hypothetical protein